MELYDAIFFRRSVRKYDKSMLGQDEIDQISLYLNSIKQLDCPPAQFNIVNKESVTYKNAPHYVLAYSNQNVRELINVGYVLQKLDLYLQGHDYGSIFLGMPKPKDGVEKDNYSIMLAFGKTLVPKRKNESEFDRLEINAISNKDCHVARCINLAPSACNAQSYCINCLENSITISYMGRGIFKRFIKNKMSKIDIGIALAHAELALLHEGKNIQNIEVFEENEDNFGVTINFN